MILDTSLSVHEWKTGKFYCDCKENILLHVFYYTYISINKIKKLFETHIRYLKTEGIWDFIMKILKHFFIVI